MICCRNCFSTWDGSVGDARRRRRVKAVVVRIADSYGGAGCWLEGESVLLCVDVESMGR